MNNKATDLLLGADSEDPITAIEAWYTTPVGSRVAYGKLSSTISCLVFHSYKE